jgi:release factor glutamine methyltransferase
MDPTIRDFEPRVALDGGEDGLRCYRELLASVKGVMAPHALILLESDPRRITRVADLCVETWPGAVTHVYQDLSGRDRVLEAQVP